MSVRHILIYAGNPYTVMDRPAWFVEALFTQVDTLCNANQIEVSLTNAGGNPCTAPSPSPSPTASPKATANRETGWVRCFLAVPLAEPGLGSAQSAAAPAP